jgi:nucleotide-binding universal stress UspA family protein
MSGIICAIRGGPRSQTTIARAIELATRANSPLYFIYVVNLDFLTKREFYPKHFVDVELEQMGEFILMLAQEKAAKSGVIAQCSIRHGNVLEELVAACKENDCRTIVLGLPEGKASLFSYETLLHTQETLEAATGATIVWVGDDAA